MKEKLIGFQILGTAIGCGAGFALAGSIGMLGGAVCAIVIAGAAAFLLVPQVLRGEEASPVPSSAPPVSVPPEAPSRKPSEAANLDFLSIAEEMAFASQQLIWGIDQ